MTEIKHTPGPWRVEPRQAGDSNDIAFNIETDDWFIAGIYFEEGTDINDPDIKANANLIAAAPEMYEILEQILQDGGYTGISIQQIEKLFNKINP